MRPQRLFHVRTLISIALLFSAGACGLKGPLYLPDSRSQPVEPIATPPGEAETPAPPSSETDDERGREKAPASDTPSPPSLPDPDRPASTPPPPGN